MDKNAKWEPIENIDYSRRTASEWAKIYGIELISSINDGRVWSEYEWAYNVFNADYRPLYISNQEYDFEKLDQMELRIFEIRRDIFLGASVGEKELLKEKYHETEWCRRRLHVL